MVLNGSNTEQYVSKSRKKASNNYVNDPLDLVVYCSECVILAYIFAKMA